MCNYLLHVKCYSSVYSSGIVWPQFFFKKTLWQFNNCEKEQKLEETLFSNENTRGMLIREKLLQKSVNLEVDDLFYFMYKYLCLEYMDG